MTSNGSSIPAPNPKKDKRESRFDKSCYPGGEGPSTHTPVEGNRSGESKKGKKEQ